MTQSGGVVHVLVAASRPNTDYSRRARKAPRRERSVSSLLPFNKRGLIGTPTAAALPLARFPEATAAASWIAFRRQGREPTRPQRVQCDGTGRPARQGHLARRILPMRPGSTAPT
jgi:hypothetical protein